MPLFGGAQSTSNRMLPWSEAYLHAKFHLDPSNCLATIDMGLKSGSSAPFQRRGTGSTCNTKSSGPSPISIPSGILIILIHPAIWPQQVKDENWGLCPFGGGARSPSNTMWPGPRPTYTPIFILIHPTVWPQYTNVTDRTGQTGQTGQTDNGLIA